MPVLVPAIVRWLWIHNTPLEWCSWMSTEPNHTHMTSKKIYHSFNKGSIFKIGIPSAGSRCHQAVLAGFVKSDQNVFSLLLFYCCSFVFPSRVFILIIYFYHFVSSDQLLYFLFHYSYEYLCQLQGLPHSTYYCLLQGQKITLKFEEMSERFRLLSLVAWSNTSWLSIYSLLLYVNLLK